MNAIEVGRPKDPLIAALSFDIVNTVVNPSIILTKNRLDLLNAMLLLNIKILSLLEHRRHVVTNDRLALGDSASAHILSTNTYQDIVSITFAIQGQSTSIISLLERRHLQEGEGQ